MENEMEGALWVATGQAHVETAVESAKTFKIFNPGKSTALFTDERIEKDAFDFVQMIPSDVIRPKIDMLSSSPFDRTIYLDNDTMVLGDLSSAYQILNKFDMAGCQVQLWQKPRHNRKYRIEVPILFPEINCGVLVYKKSKKTDDFFLRWSKEYLASGLKIDQTTFRETLWDTDIQFCVLPEQMNKRLIDPCELIYTDKPASMIVHLPILRPTKSIFRKLRQNISKFYFLGKNAHRFRS